MFENYEIAIVKAEINLCKASQQLLTAENKILREQIQANVAEKLRYKKKQRKLEQKLKQLAIPNLFTTDEKLHLYYH